MTQQKKSHLAEILARIDERLAALDMTESAASKAAGKGEAIRNMRRTVDAGKDEAGVSTATLFALAPVLGCTPGWLVDGTTTEPAKPELGLSEAQALVVERVFRGFLEGAEEDPVLRAKLQDPAYLGGLAIIVSQYARSRTVHEAVARGDEDTVRSLISLGLEQWNDT